jgi:hypothetical protein
MLVRTAKSPTYDLCCRENNMVVSLKRVEEEAEYTSGLCHESQIKHSHLELNVKAALGHFPSPTVKMS